MSDWSDRRGLFQKGREKAADPTNIGREFGERRSSAGSITDAGGRSSLDKTMSNSSGGGSPTDSRRRSSNSGLFGNLEKHKRGSQDYGERRMSHVEQMKSGGILSGWYNSTFRGVQKTPTQSTDQPK